MYFDYFRRVVLAIVSTAILGTGSFFLQYPKYVQQTYILPQPYDQVVYSHRVCSMSEDVTLRFGGRYVETCEYTYNIPAHVPVIIDGVELVVGCSNVKASNENFEKEIIRLKRQVALTTR